MGVQGPATPPGVEGLIRPKRLSASVRFLFQLYLIAWSNVKGWKRNDGTGGGEAAGSAGKALTEFGG